MNKQTLRDSFWDEVYEHARKDSNIVIVSADLAAPSLDKFRKDMPSQFISVGIAEQNAIEISAGLALTGKKVFTYACAPFITLRSYEQIRLLLSGMKLPVTVVGQGAGFSYFEFGPTHHVLEDIGVMRMLPHMSMYCLSDGTMAKAVASNSIKKEGPEYIRVDRLAPNEIYSLKENLNLEKGFNIIEQGKEMAIIATGNMVHNALAASKVLKTKGIEVKVIDLFKIPIKVDKFIKEIGNLSKIITLEEHSLACGIGSMICEILIDNKLYIDVRRLAVDSRDGYCYRYGGREYMQKLYGLNVDNIISEIIY